ncbi:MAG: peptidoglycan DD-metalloendopeptidase family protein [Burkholderiales bacterium]|nr:peptidoglycan DD-metalloendopeptidase family protein [Burkholderiales bacterium]
MHIISNHSRLLASAAVVLTLMGCASPTHRAPVEERSRGPAASAPGSTRRVPTAFDLENAGKPGFYTVKPGDTLIRISLESGQNWRDLASWNNLDNPNVIEVGQVLRVVPPGENVTAGAATKPIAPPKVEARTIEAKPGASGAASAASAAKPAASAASVIEAKETKEVKDADEPNWQWPATGPILGGFEEGKRKGVAIGGKTGDPIFAAADGRVVYAGSGLRGYGNLIIIKHNAEYLTAYAHNQTLLVKEDQAVRKGQKIAEMGSTDADRVQLHFEIRRQGKPVDPVRQLPTR